MIAIAFSLALMFAASQSVDAQARARQFLEAFAANPAAAKQFATEDATIIVGDIGGPYGDYVKIIQSAGSWMKTCRVASLAERPGPSADELKDAPPRYRGGKLSLIEGAYACARPDGTKFDYKFDVILKDDRVLQLALGEGSK